MIKRATNMMDAFVKAAENNGKTWMSRQVADRVLHTNVGIVKEFDKSPNKPAPQVHPRVMA